MTKEMISRFLFAKARLHRAREENASLRTRIAALEAQLAALSPAPEAQQESPAEQAVTEAIKRFERIADIIERNLWRQDEKVEDAKQIAIEGAEALKAAMEARDDADR